MAEAKGSADCALSHSVDELLAASDGGTKEDNRLDRMLCCLQNLLGEPEFASWRDTFCKAYCGEFEEGDESSLACMDIHRQYMAQFEKRVEATLVAEVGGFEMSEFLALVAAHPDDVSPELSDELLSMSDFSEFKALMLSYKNPIDLGLNGSGGIMGIGVTPTTEVMPVHTLAGAVGTEFGVQALSLGESPVVRAELSSASGADEGLSPLSEAKRERNDAFQRRSTK
jgi:hypothetical protein